MCLLLTCCQFNVYCCVVISTADTDHMCELTPYIPEETVSRIEAENIIGGFATIILQPQPHSHIPPNEFSDAV